MAGHSQWANIRHRKAAVDSKRSRLWSKLSKAIIVAAKLGGGDPDANIRLRTAILDAKAVSMPRDNIDRAIKKGTGELAGGDMEEMLYEGYGPGGVAVLCDITTDNRNRTASEIRKIFDDHDGKLGSTNCVAYLFERKGIIVVPGARTSLDRVMEVALEHGAEDVEQAGDQIQVTCPTENLQMLADAFNRHQIEIDRKEVERVPSTTVEVDGETAAKVFRLLEQLDEHDDVQSVSSNVQFSTEQLQLLAS